MTTTIADSVELLGRAVEYTCPRLGEVEDDLLGRRTPCADWRLGALLAHMEDSLDAFTEAAGGRVALPVGAAAPGVAGRIGAIRLKAGALVGAWRRTCPGDVLVGGLDLASPILISTAALEVAVHGWDVGQATGSGAPLPRELAAELLPVARATVDATDRGLRFAAPLPTHPADPADRRLLAFLGRGTD